MKEYLKAYYIDLVKGRRKGVLAALFSFFLLLFSFIYGFFVKLVLSCYQTGLLKSAKPDCRIISVGNITWGGTGKTPLVEVLAKFFKQEGKNPAILIRGYGKDEVYMLKDKFKDIPVLAGRNRIKTAGIARKRYAADTVILDDGFQHWRLKRDLDIVLIDASSPFGNKRLIPRGILREPLSSLSRADVFVLTGTELVRENTESIKKELRRYNCRAPIYEAIHSPIFLRNLTSNEKTELSAIKNRPIALISGVARPQSFAKTLDLLEAKIALRFYFPDHYRYRKEDLERIERACLERQIKTVVTTEKDAPKLTALLKSKKLKLEVLTLCIELKIIKDEEKFFRFLKGDKKRDEPYSILILSDAKAGHLNQSKAVAGIIQKRKTDQGMKDGQLSTKTAEVKFRNGFCRILLGLCSIFSGPPCCGCLHCLHFCLQKSSFDELTQIPADIIVSAGSSLSAVNLFLSYRNKAQKVILMKPAFANLDRFDLVIMPEHDRVKPKNNVLLTRIAPNLIDQQYLQEQADILKTRYKILDTRYQTKGLALGVLIGGDTAKYRLSIELINKIISQLKKAAENLDCQVLVTTSRRTPKMVEKLLKENFAGFPRCKLLVIANEENIPQAVGGILGLSDIIVVSGESISMVSEAISAGKYILAFIPEKKPTPLEAISLTRRAASTKQERFLKNLEKEDFIKIIHPDNLLPEIEKFCKDKPYRKKIQDRELIYQALGRLI